MTEQRRKATRNRFIFWLVLIILAAVLAGLGGNYNNMWLVFATAAFSELFSQLYYIEEAIRELPR